ncbi:MAG: hypothetical protein A3K65_01390 [Euryarchaeota archaeon RBG_16_68_12]|nr:MAG: hypothetical protein A3K65_01390 [Euryarchaeota archaeon RBG_16_68_12]
MASETSDSTFDLKLHIRRIRAELEARGIWVDDELDDAMMEMMRAGREAVEVGRSPLADETYKEAAKRLHRLVKLREDGSYVPQIVNYAFPALLGKVDEINRSLRKRTRFPPGLYKLIDMANRKARSEQEFRTYLREIEWHLRMT